MSVADLLAEQGPLAEAIKGYALREPQRDLATAIEDAIDHLGVLVAEVGTGVGKTYAYLLPAILSHKKVLISTGTRPLQDQLFHRDLPLLLKILGVSLNHALLKGRRNYLCLYRMQHLEASSPDTEFYQHLAIVKSWSKITQSGDLAEVSELPENAAILPKVTSTVDNCLGRECPMLAECHLFKARKKAQDADIVVANHHLFMADIVLKEEGFGEVLPNAEVFIFDEAHQLPELSSLFFSESVSNRHLLDLSKECCLQQPMEAPEATVLTALASQLEANVRVFRSALGTVVQRQSWTYFSGDKTVLIKLEAVCKALSAFYDELLNWASSGPGLENCLKRAANYIDRLSRFQQSRPGWVYWLEITHSGFSLNMTPLNVGHLFSAHMKRYRAAWVFTSATLAVGGDFQHFVSSLGLDSVVTLQLDSPFDYQRQSLLYLPEGLPEPNSGEFNNAMHHVMVSVLNASMGRAFLLFTSYRALHAAADYLRNQISFPLFIQGEAPRSQLLDQFRKAGNGVLLGTSSFWEGVDIKGQALSCIIIDRLPFASPADPVLQARLAALKEQGVNPFMSYQLPQAVIALKQGVGRLIRDAADTGVVVICDVRLQTKFYRKYFISSLPPMPQTCQIADVSHFFTRSLIENVDGCDDNANSRDVVVRSVERPQ